jgi:hypothetical protein
MARTIHRLSPAKVKTAKPGMHCDGGGLYLQCTVNADGRMWRSWLFRYSVNGKDRQMGIGSFVDVSLATARKKAAECRQQRVGGVDPIEARKGDQREGYDVRRLPRPLYRRAPIDLEKP